MFPGFPADTAGDPHYAAFNVRGSDTLNITSLGGGRGLFGAGIATINLRQNATLTGKITDTLDGQAVINGAPGSKLQHFSIENNGGTEVVNVPLVDRGTIDINVGYPSNGGTVELGAETSETINIHAGHLLIDQPMQFLQSGINWDGAPMSRPSCCTKASTPTVGYSTARTSTCSLDRGYNSRTFIAGT